MIDLFYPPKPYELCNQEPSFIHRIYDDPDEPETAYERRLRLMREWHQKHDKKKFRIPKL